MSIPGIIVIVVAAVVIVFFIVRHLLKSRPPKEHTVVVNSSTKAGKIAVRFAKSNGFRIIAPAVVQGKNKTANLEAIVIGPFGILGIKGLGYYGNVYGTKDEAEWLNVTTLGARTKFPNPIVEGAADVRAIRDALFAKNIKMVPVEVANVFTAKEVQLGVPRDAGHYTLKTFKAYLNREKFMEEKNFRVEKAEEAIRAALKPPAADAAGAG